MLPSTGLSHLINSTLFIISWQMMPAGAAHVCWSWWLSCQDFSSLFPSKCAWLHISTFTFSVHLYLFPPVMELDFIAKGDGFHKVEIFLNLINYLFTHRPFPDGLQSARSWTTLSCNVKYNIAKQAVFFPWQYQTQMPTFLAHFLNS